MTPRLTSIGPSRLGRRSAISPTCSRPGERTFLVANMETDISVWYLATVALWIVVPGIFFLRTYKSKFPVVGLLLAYCIQLALIHLTGALLQLIPWYDSATRKATIIGFPVTAYALIGLLL